MKKLALALAATAAFAGQALAADLPTKVRPMAPPPVPVATWTGCYVGGGIGYGLTDTESRMYAGPPLVAAVTAVNPSFDHGGRGWIGSVSGGCDYQFGLGSGGGLFGTGQWLIGVFGDYNWSDMHGGYTGNGGQVGLVSGTDTVDSYWSVGGRIGWLITPAVLTYFSGGYTEATRSGVSNYLALNNVATGVGLRGATVSGWFLGSGIEYQIGFIPNLTLKTEYRFSEFNSVDRPEYTVATGVNTGFFTRDKLFTQTVMTTLSYRFNWGMGKAPVIAKY